MFPSQWLFNNENETQQTTIKPVRHSRRDNKRKKCDSLWIHSESILSETLKLLARSQLIWSLDYASCSNIHSTELSCFRYLEFGEKGKATTSPAIFQYIFLAVQHTARESTEEGDQSEAVWWKMDLPMMCGRIPKPQLELHSNEALQTRGSSVSGRESLTGSCWVWAIKWINPDTAKSGLFFFVSAKTASACLRTSLSLPMSWAMICSNCCKFAIVERRAFWKFDFDTKILRLIRRKLSRIDPNIPPPVIGHCQIVNSSD